MPTSVMFFSYVVTALAVAACIGSLALCATGAIMQIRSQRTARSIFVRDYPNGRLTLSLQYKPTWDSSEVGWKYQWNSSESSDIKALLDEAFSSISGK